jgi:DNA-binding NtrC family response regulator
MQRVCPAPEGTLLAVGTDEEDLFYLRSICAGTGWKLHEAHTVARALGYLNGESVSVVLCDEHLPDGRWTAVLDNVVRLPEPPLLIVWTRNADNRLWAEVLNLGGFDVLAAPFQVAEAVHVISAALRNWQRREVDVDKVRELGAAE